MIEDVEAFCPELQGVSFADDGVLCYREVDALKAGRFENVASGVAEGSGLVERESRSVDPF